MPLPPSAADAQLRESRVSSVQMLGRKQLRARLREEEMVNYDDEVVD